MVLGRRSVHRPLQLHAMCMTGAWTAFLASMLLRFGGEGPITGASIIAGAIGSTLLVAGGWFGGELVYHHGVGCRNPSKTPIDGLMANDGPK